MTHCFLKTDYFDKKKLFKNVIAPFISLLLTPLKQKLMDYSLQN